MSDRLQRNAASKRLADHDGEPWSDDELEWLRSWDGDPAYLVELAELLGRTIEACRERYHVDRRGVVRVTRTTTVTTETVYRGWKEGDGDGWD